jgi:DNA polymerase-3 subunit beta
VKATIETKALREALRKVHMIPKSKQLPILADVRMDFNDSKMTLRSTDMNQAITIEVDCKSDSHFTVIAPRQTTLQFLSGGNGNTTITFDNPKKAIIERDDMGIVNLYTNDAEDFPPIPQSDNIEWHAFDAKWFCKMLGILITACATEGSRPVLTGIVFHNGGMGSADGFRLASVKSDKLNFGLRDKRAIVPSITANLAKRLFGKEETVDIGFEMTASGGFNKELEPRRVYFKSGNTSLMAELTQGNYPNYEQLIPKDFICKSTFSVPLMTQRLQMIDAPKIASGITRFIFTTTEKGEDICKLSARSEDEVDYAMSLPIKMDGEESKIGFNHKYVMDAIKPFSICHLETTSFEAPGKFTGDIEELTIVVMPMFVQW